MVEAHDRAVVTLVRVVVIVTVVADLVRVWVVPVTDDAVLVVKVVNVKLSVSVVSVAVDVVMVVTLVVDV